MRRVGPAFAAHLGFLTVAGTLVACGGTSARHIDADAAADASVNVDRGGDGPVAPPDMTPGFVVAVLPSSLHVLSLDAAGTLTTRHIVERPDATRYIALSADGRFLYTVGGKVAAFSVDPASGRLGAINEVETGLSNPSALIVDTSGKWLIVSGYSEGVVVFSLRTDGGVGGPAGAIVGGPTANAGAANASGKIVLVPSCDGDVIDRYLLDSDTGALIPQDRPIQLPAGAGPGRIAVHSSGNTAYVMNAKQQTITSFIYTPANGTLSDPETVPILTTGQPLLNGNCAFRHMVLHPSGKFIYATVPEGGGTVAIMSIATSGRLSVVGHEQYFLFRGADPLAIDPTGTFLLVGNTAGALQVFRIDPVTGTLTYVSFGVQGVVALDFANSGHQ